MTANKWDPDIWATEVLQKVFRYEEQGGSEERYTLLHWKGTYYQWRGGCYIAISDGDVERIITRLIQKHNDMLDADDENRISITPHHVRSIMLCLRGRIGIPSSRPMNSWPDGREKRVYNIVVENGMLEMDRKDPGSILLKDHDIDYFTPTRLPYEYDSDAGCPRFKKFMRQIMPKKPAYRRLLQQWAGYLFRPDLREQKFLLCVGDGANGKGVFFEIIQELVGRVNCSQVTLPQFKNQFGLYSTIGKVVNVTNESSDFIKKDAEVMVKSYVAGDMLTFDRKHKDPISARPTAKLMIATNDLPRFTDRSEGIWRRILLANFEETFRGKQQDKMLVSKLKEELPGILNWALRGLTGLTASNGFTLPKAHARQLEEYRIESDPARAFLTEWCELKDESYVDCSELYGRYEGYCWNNGYKKLASSQFGKCVKKAFPDSRRVQRGGRAYRSWKYEGIHLRPKRRRRK